jgi:hypothetical protein
MVTLVNLKCFLKRLTYLNRTCFVPMFQVYFRKIHPTQIEKNEFLKKFFKFYSQKGLKHNFFFDHKENI